MEVMQTICWWIGKIFVFLSASIFLFGIYILLKNYYLSIKERTWLFQFYEYHMLKSVMNMEKKRNYINIEWKYIEYWLDVFENKEFPNYRKGLNFFRKKIIKMLKDSQNSELYIIYKQTH